MDVQLSSRWATYIFSVGYLLILAQKVNRIFLFASLYWTFSVNINLLARFLDWIPLKNEKIEVKKMFWTLRLHEKYFTAENDLLKGDFSRLYSLYGNLIFAPIMPIPYHIKSDMAIGDI